jgi:hypothetical protein
MVCVGAMLRVWAWYSIGSTKAESGSTLGAVRRVLWLPEADNCAGVQDGHRGHQDMHIRVEECTGEREGGRKENEGRKGYRNGKAKQRNGHGSHGRRRIVGTGCAYILASCDGDLHFVIQISDSVERGESAHLNAGDNRIKAQQQRFRRSGTLQGWSSSTMRNPERKVRPGWIR